MTNKIYLSYADVERRVTDIIDQMLLSEWSPEIIVGITRGGLFPALLMSQFYNSPMHCIQVSMRNGSISRSAKLELVRLADSGKRILIVDDINDSGATLGWIVMALGRASPSHLDRIGHDIRFATLVNNLDSSFKSVDYTGLEVHKGKEDWYVFPYEDWWKSHVEAEEDEEDQL